MSEPRTIAPSLVTEIVRSFVAHNSIAASELPNLIATATDLLPSSGRRKRHRHLSQRSRSIDPTAQAS